jgi:predicted Rossmann fold nucleotide-binding protein DprA/Smf involved in DNA uptake
MAADTFASFLSTLERLSPGTAVAARPAEPTTEERRAWQVAVVSVLAASGPLDIDHLIAESHLEVNQVQRALEDLQQMGAVSASTDAHGKVSLKLTQQFQELLDSKLAAAAG